MTGKTTYVASCISKAAENLGDDNIIVASFTKTAAAELAGRDLPINPDQIGTLHAHCYRALGRPPLADDTKLIKEWNEEYPMYAMSGAKGDIDEGGCDATYTTDGDEIYAELQILRHRLIPEEEWSNRVLAFNEKWRRFKAHKFALDFTDLIEQASLVCDTAPGHPVIGFFDEVQDFTRLEIGLVRKWGAKMDYVMMAGDDDQSLYDFKGATPDAFLDPPVDDEHKRVLSQSWRVPRAIQTLAEGIIRQVSRREPKVYSPRDYEGEVYRLSTSVHNVEALLADAQKHLDAGKSVMFLTACGYMLDPIKAHLRREGIPFHNPFRTKRGDWNPLGRSRGTSAADRVFAYLRPISSVENYHGDMWHADELKRWADPLNSKLVMKHGAKKLIDGFGVESEEDKFADVGEVPIAQLLEVFNEDALTSAMSFDLNWYRNNLLSSKVGTMEYPIQIAQKRGVEILRETPKVIIGTIHSVKGGEADVVYLFPDLSRAGAIQWQNGGLGRDTIIRQFYVGATRARDTLVLCEPSCELSVALW